MDHFLLRSALIPTLTITSWVIVTSTRKHSSQSIRAPPDIFHTPDAKTVRSIEPRLITSALACTSSPPHARSAIDETYSFVDTNRRYTFKYWILALLIILQQTIEKMMCSNIEKMNLQSSVISGTFPDDPLMTRLREREHRFWSLILRTRFSLVSSSQ